MRFAFIEIEKACFTVSMLCRVMQVTRAGFYAWKNALPSLREQEDARLSGLLKQAHEDSRNTYGAPRLHQALEKQGIRTSEKRVARLMKSASIKGKHWKRFKVPTTDSNHEFPIAENMLAQDFTANAPNQIWASDVTELVVPNSRLFLAVVLDLFSRKVVGWSLSKVNDAMLAETALNRGLSTREMNGIWIHHSDKGSPYASFNYQKLIDGSGGVCSMSGTGNCYDNAVVESFNATFKRELGERFSCEEDAQGKVFDYIEVFYNRQRFHSTLGRGTSPAEFEEKHFACVKAAEFSTEL
jgi:putative transposase